MLLHEGAEPEGRGVGGGPGFAVGKGETASFLGGGEEPFAWLAVRAMGEKSKPIEARGVAEDVRDHFVCDEAGWVGECVVVCAEEEELGGGAWLVGEVFAQE